MTGDWGPVLAVAAASFLVSGVVESVVMKGGSAAGAVYLLLVAALLTARTPGAR